MDGFGGQELRLLLATEIISTYKARDQVSWYLGQDWSMATRQEIIETKPLIELFMQKIKFS